MTLEWRFQHSFEIDITRDADTVCVGFRGDLDAFTAKMLRRAAPIPTVQGSVVLDLSRLGMLDASGAREIRRIEAAINESGGCAAIRGATNDAQEMLDLIPAAPRA